MKLVKLLRAALVAGVLVSTLTPLPVAAKTVRPVNPQLKAAQDRAKAQRKVQRRLAKKLQKQRKTMAQH